MNTLDTLKQVQIAMRGVWAVGLTGANATSFEKAMLGVEQAIADMEAQEPKCVAIVEVFGKDWRLEYMSLPVGRHKLYAQQYLYTHPQPKASATQEPVAWCRYEDGMWVYYETKAWDDLQPLYTHPQPKAEQKRKPLTDDQKDAARYRWLFNDVDLAAIKAAFDSGTTPPASPHSEIIGEIVGFYTDKQGADMMIDAAIEAAHNIKGKS